MSIRKIILANLVTFLVSHTVFAQDSAEPSAEDMAKKLANPIAALISFPLQFNYDESIGIAGEGENPNLKTSPVA